MSDDTTPLGDLRDMVRAFVRARDWEQFHAPKNLAMALAIEAAELMEHFQWLTVDQSRDVAALPNRQADVAEEMADVLCYLLALANELNVDLSTAVHDKMRKNAVKYPVEEYRGRYGPEDR
jgi:NTP pyrophosphatase (non-canonical NTP hydrolase)